jgi:hypothetical protein
VSDASLPLQAAIVSRLRNDAAVSAIVAGRVYDLVKPDTSFPYVSIGDDQVVGERAECYDGCEVNVPIHAWSRAVGFPELKRLTAAIQTSLLAPPLTLTGFRLVDAEITETRHLRDPDGATSHGILTLRVLAEPAD